MLIDAPFPCELGCLRSILWRSPELCVTAVQVAVTASKMFQISRKNASFIPILATWWSNVIHASESSESSEVIAVQLCSLQPSSNVPGQGGSNKMSLKRLLNCLNEHQRRRTQAAKDIVRAKMNTRWIWHHSRPNSSCGPWNHEHLERFERCIWSIWITVGWCWMLWLTCMNIPKNYGCFLFRSMTVEQKYLDALIGQDPTNNGCADWRHLDV